MNLGGLTEGRRGLASGIVIGLVLGAGVTWAAILKSRPNLPVPGSADLPLVEVVVGHQSVRALRAASAEARVAAWTEGMVRGNSVLMVWDKPGVYPVMDVPSGWRVAWIRDGKVQALCPIQNAGQNISLPEEVVTSALVFPAEAGITPGESVAVR